MKKYNGFTLIELMIVMAVVSILIVVGAPSMRAYFANSFSNSLSNTLLIDIMYARNHAISNSVIVKMSPLGSNPNAADNEDTGLSLFIPNTTGVNWGWGWVIYVDNNDNDNLDLNEQIIRKQASFGPDALISSGPAGELLDIDSPIGFNASGFAYGQGINTGRGTLTIGSLGCAGMNAKTIQINQIGQVIGTDIQCPLSFTNN